MGRKGDVSELYLYQQIQVGGAVLCLPISVTRLLSVNALHHSRDIDKIDLPRVLVVLAGQICLVAQCAHVVRVVGTLRVALHARGDEGDESV